MGSLLPCLLPCQIGSARRGCSLYGASCIIEPFGRVLVEAPRDEAVALVAEIDLGQREDWLTLFPFFATCRPDTYSALTDDKVNPRQPNGDAQYGGIPGIKQ